MVQAATLLSLVVKFRLWERMVVHVAKLTRAAVEVVGKEGRWRWRPATSKMTSLLAATLGPFGGVAAGHKEGLGVALPYTSARRSRLFPEVFDDCSYVGCRLSPRDRAIIRELNETAFAWNLQKTGGVGRSE